MHTFEVVGLVGVSVECPVGEVLVSTGDAPRAEVEVTPLRDDDTTREAVERTVVELRGDRLVVEVPRRNGAFFGREPAVRVEVRVPHGSGLSFRTASADVTATGRLGEVRGKTASGDVRVTEAAAVRVETASGDLRIDTVAGDAELRSASGDVAVERAGGAVAASVVSGDLRVGTAERGGSFSAVSGDVEVSAILAGDVDLRTVSGDVTLGIAAGARVHVDVTTVSGDLRSEVELSDAPVADADGPLVAVRGRTVSGDLRVRKAGMVETH
ncbi:MAG TPA: DUF4097 family beta strand repeat-containing protein [Frankiaceae bacterium]|nr:DUF4097 family beta strand repeat-containing protein [Frankiaceae bacterium]